MASLRKVGKRWQAQVARRGVRKSKLFDSKLEAKDWAAHQEHLILTGQGEHGPGKLADLFDRYAREVSPKKRGARWEQIRLEKLSRDKIAEIAIRDLRPGDFADWRDRRLREVSPSSVIREMNLLSAVMSVARREWGLIQTNPLADVSKPSQPPPRDRRVSEAELLALREAAVSDAERRAIEAFAFAIETAMRAGEIMSLTELDGRVARLKMTKNGKPRDVPLSSKAIELFPEGGFGLTPKSLDVLFRRVRDRAGVEGLTFHDSRREAISRMSRKVDVLALARIVGHSNVNQLRTYYNESPEDLAERLD